MTAQRRRDLIVVAAGAGLRPHRVETFKLSNDPDFEAKLIDVVGLYLGPAGERGGAVRGREVPVPGP